MAQEIRMVKTLEIAEEDCLASSSAAAQPSLLRNLSGGSRLNARAPEFVPRAPAVVPQHQQQAPAASQAAPAATRVKIHHAHPQLHPAPVVHVVYHHPPPPVAPVAPQFILPFHPHQNHPPLQSPPLPQHEHDYYADHEVDLDQRHPSVVAPVAKDGGLSEDVAQKVTKQVEYYFSDANLATTEHLMRFISKDPEGFVPITVIASFKKIKALVHSTSLLADALRISSKLVVSEDGKKVRRQQAFTESDVEELQSRIIVAENLPDDHCYQSLMKVFSVAGSVKTIRTCYPQTPNGTTTATNRSSKLDMLFANKLHAFVEYETADDAEKAVSELNDERNWRSGLRVRLLSSCMVPSKPGQVRGKKPGLDGEGNAEEEETSPTNQLKTKQLDLDPSQPAETSHEHMGEDVPNGKEAGTAKRGKGRGRGGGSSSSKGRGRGYHHSNNHHRGPGIGGPTIGTPPGEQAVLVSKQPPGPRMPDGTRGFTMGRGKPFLLPTTGAAV